MQDDRTILLARPNMISQRVSVSDRPHNKLIQQTGKKNANQLTNMTGPGGT